MGGISGLFGGAGGASGSGYAAPAGTNPQDLNAAQANVSNTQAQQQAFVNQLNAQNGLGNQQAVFGQQQALANQLQGVANGTGPNPAMAQLAQTTGQNIAQQGALQAGQRGSSANAGLMARNIAQQGGQLQQQAVGQGATMAAQQQLAGMQQLQNQQASMGNLANTQVGQQQSGIAALNQNALQGQANLLNIQGNMNTANAGLARQSMTNQSQAGQAGMGMLSKLPGMFSGSGSSSGIPGASSDASGGAGIATDGTTAGSTTGGGDIISGAGGFGGSAGLGGDSGSTLGNLGTSTFASGGEVDDSLEQPLQNQEVNPVATPQMSTGPKSSIGQYLVNQNNRSNTAADDALLADTSSGGSSGGNPMSGMMGQASGAMSGVMDTGAQNSMDFFGGKSGSAAGEAGQGVGKATEAVAPELLTVALAAKGGKVPAMVSPGEQYLPPKDVQKVVQQGKNPLAVGERIPGKPKFKGNNYANDIVPKTLESGGIVIPNKIMQSKNPHFEAMKFVHATIAKNRKGLK